MMKSIGAIVAATGLLVTVSGCSSHDTSGPSRTTSADMSFAFDIADKPTLAGFSDAVFVGRVAEKVGSKPLTTGLPAGQYRVDVIDTLKGEPQSTYVVTQEGGPEESGDVILVEDDPLLTVGSTYLFAGRLDAQSGAIVVVPRYGDVPLNVDGGVLRTQGEASTHPQVAAMRQAIAVNKVVPRLPGTSASPSAKG